LAREKRNEKQKLDATKRRRLQKETKIMETMKLVLIAVGWSILTILAGLAVVAGMVLIGTPA
jgi:hypothetical protein